MANDSYVQVAPDSTGKQVDMELTGTAAGANIYRQRALLVGDPADVMQQLLVNSNANLAVLRAILTVLTVTSNVRISEEDFSNPS